MLYKRTYVMKSAVHNWLRNGTASISYIGIPLSITPAFYPRVFRSLVQVELNSLVNRLTVVTHIWIHQYIEKKHSAMVWYTSFAYYT